MTLTIFLTIWFACLQVWINWKIYTHRVYLRHHTEKRKNETIPLVMVCIGISILVFIMLYGLYFLL